MTQDGRASSTLRRRPPPERSLLLAAFSYKSGKAPWWRIIDFGGCDKRAAVDDNHLPSSALRILLHPTLAVRTSRRTVAVTKALCVPCHCQAKAESPHPNWRRRTCRDSVHVHTCGNVRGYMACPDWCSTGISLQLERLDVGNLPTISSRGFSAPSALAVLTPAHHALASKTMVAVVN